MDLVNIRDLYREQKEYLEKEVMTVSYTHLTLPTN